MARPRNEQAQERIAACAIRQFLEKGYKRTSYQSIYEETGYSRAYIQHYFPKKELMLENLISRAMKICDFEISRLRPGCSLLEGMFLAGQTYFAFLSHPDNRAFVLDVLESRSLTNDLIGLNERYETFHTGLSHDAREDVSDGIIRIVGGSYQLLYTKLSLGKTISAAEESLRVVEGFMDLVGVERSGFKSSCYQLAFSSSELDRLVSFIGEKLRKYPFGDEA